MIQHILVPYDFTHFADLAFDKAAEIARKFNSKLTLITIVGSDVDTTGMSFQRAQEFHDEIETKAHSDLLEKSSPYKDLSISVQVINNPSPSDGILSFAEKNNVDMIVMGSHGRAGFRKLVLGSVASSITAKSHCPVLIVKSQNN